MTATKELRALLDERGVEWSAIHDTCTSWYMSVGNQMRDGFRVPVWYDGTLHIECVMTPVQAIAATLGRGTCKLSRGTSGLMHVTTGHCSECGAEVVKGTKDGYRSRYCQWCGAKVVGE